MKLSLSKDLDVPLNFVTEKHAWIGTTGSGKTYGAQRSAEQLWHARAPFVVLDPKGDWWGLRLAADGKKDGFPIPVFGGLHGDVPLEPTAGALIANLIFDKNISAVVDVSQFDTDADRTRFVTAFLDQLYTRHKRAPTARHLYMEECQEFIPQNPQPGEQRLLHVAQRVQKMGRGVGLGTSLITQRPQEVSKKALNQAQTIFMFRLTGSQERKAMKEWVTSNGLTDELMAGLPELATGTCHVWSPAWLKTFATIKIARKETFDASATPEVGVQTVAHELAPIDLDQLREAMKATIEKAKAEDPIALRARIAALEKQVRLGCTPDVRVEVKRVEVPVLKEADIKRLEVALERAVDRHEAAMETVLTVGRALAQFKAFRDAPKPATPRLGLVAVLSDTLKPRHHSIPAPRREPIPVGDLTGPQTKILAALVFLESIGVDQPSKVQVALFVGSSPSSSTYANNLGALRSKGLIDYPNGGAALTEAGRMLAPRDGAPTTTDELHAIVLGMVTGPQRLILEKVFNIYPNAISKEILATSVGVSATSSTFANNLGAMRTMGALIYPRGGEVRAADIMFIGEAVSA